MRYSKSKSPRGLARGAKTSQTAARKSVHLANGGVKASFKGGSNVATGPENSPTGQPC